METRVERDRDVVAEGRARTDESLGTERATADTSLKRLEAERKLDALIARDRVVADHRLMMFRRGTDRVLADERSASPAASSEVIGERLAADGSMRAERSATDAALEQARRGTDERTRTRREQGTADRVERETQRADTNERLSDERGNADDVSADREQSRSALEAARHAELHHRNVFAMVAHDLRNPLCAIVANAHFLAESVEDTEMHEATQDVILAAARMGRLLTDLLDVAQVDAGRFPLTKAPHEAGALLSEVGQTYRRVFEDRGVSLAIDVPEEEIIASFDRDRLMQLLSNLLGNAIKFTPPGGNVSLKVEQSAQRLVFLVRDDGTGIHPDALPRIFERFWQRDVDSRRGLGLGLYLCRTIAKAHGGEISVESELGGGTTFRVSLPMG